MPKLSAGLLMYRIDKGNPQVLLVHPGGPFWRNKDDGAWTIPKGEINEGEDLLDAARREFEEETGHKPSGRFIQLPAIRQESGKLIHAWAFEGDLDAAAIKSNTFTMEWPPKSGKTTEFPDVDRAMFFNAETAKKKINPAQVAFVNELMKLLTIEIDD